MFWKNSIGGGGRKNNKRKSGSGPLSGELRKRLRDWCGRNRIHTGKKRVQRASPRPQPDGAQSPAEGLRPRCRETAWRAERWTYRDRRESATGAWANDGGGLDKRDIVREDGTVHIPSID